MRIACNILLERRLKTDQHSDTFPLAAPSTPSLLPQAGHRSRESHVECSIKRANIDAELESTCGGHAEELAREKGLWMANFSGPFLWRGSGEPPGEEKLF
jgi:hypothetical protein